MKSFVLLLMFPLSLSQSAADGSRRLAVTLRADSEFLCDSDFALSWIHTLFSLYNCPDGGTIPCQLLFWHQSNVSRAYFTAGFVATVLSISHIYVQHLGFLKSLWKLLPIFPVNIEQSLKPSLPSVILPIVKNWSPLTPSSPPHPLLLLLLLFVFCSFLSKSQVPEP